MPRVEVVCVGTELLLDRVNTDVNIISRLLGRIGLSVDRVATVPDRLPEIVGALKDAAARAGVVIATGGLGPTFDDLTREAAARALDRMLAFSDAAWAPIAERFARRGVVPPASNRRQAEVIDGARVLPNEAGTAPGQIVEVDGTVFILLPGPPSELAPMVERSVLPELAARFGGSPAAVHRFAIAGVAESVVEERCRDLVERLGGAGVEFTILTSPGVIDLVARISDPDRAAVVGELRSELAGRFGRDFVGIDPPSLPELVGAVLKERRLTLGLAESCTGGLIARMLTDAPGSSAFFAGGVVAYSNRMKRRALGVGRSTLRAHGAVSRETALGMARGARKACGAPVSLAVTGIAGPGGGSGDKPVGLVWVAAGLPRNRFSAARLMLPGNRGQVRERAAYAALDFLRRAMEVGPC